MSQIIFAGIIVSLTIYLINDNDRRFILIMVELCMVIMGVRAIITIYFTSNK